ncbi:hypothetical protein JCM18237_26440 [Halorubrum luteum]
MTVESIRVSRKEFRSGEVLDRLDDGQRVFVTVETFGVSRDVALRKNENGYVCDTGMKLLTYEDRDGMRQCIDRLRLTVPDDS